MGQSWYQLDWVWTATGWALAAIGGALLWWALFRDRSRGRRRCPKCWYDMTGVPELRCPECGKCAARETLLLKCRRRWRWAAVAMLTLAVSWIAASLPQIQLSGWPGVIPTTALVLCFRWLERPTFEEQSTWRKGGLPFAKRLFMDLRFNRFDKGRISAWQRRILWSRMLVGDANDPIQLSAFWAKYEMWAQLMRSDTVATEAQQLKLLEWTVPLSLKIRGQWPEGVPIVVWVQPSQYWQSGPRGRVLRFRAPSDSAAPVCVPSMGPDWWHTQTEAAAWNYHYQIEIPARRAGEPVMVDVEAFDFDNSANPSGTLTCTRTWSRRVRINVDIVGHDRDILKPAVGEHDHAPLAISLPQGNLSLVHGPGPVSMSGVVFALRAELLRDGDVVATGNGWFWSQNGYNIGSALTPGISLAWRIPVPSRAQMDNHRWTAHIVGDPTIALQSPRGDTYWVGDEVVSPIIQEWTTTDGKPLSRRPSVWTPPAALPPFRTPDDAPAGR